MPKSLWKGLFLSDFLTEAFLNSSRNLYTTAELALQAILSFMSYTHIAEVSVVTCRWGPGTFQYMGPKNQNGGPFEENFKFGKLFMPPGHLLSFLS